MDENTFAKLIEEKKQNTSEWIITRKVDAMESENKKVDVQDLLKQRGQVHGEFVTHAEICQNLKRAAHMADNWDSLDSSMKESIEMVLHKIARILNGNPNHKDHWVDVAGYATLVSNQLGGEQ